MEVKKAIKALSAMAQETRLMVLKILVKHGTDGAPAGVISKELKIPHNTLSFHLSHLSNAGLVSSERTGRSIVYFANFKEVQKLIDYIMDNCCEKSSCSPSQCEPSGKNIKGKNAKTDKKTSMQACC